MQRTLGTTSVFAICTGAMFSSGFFLLPGLAAAESGPAIPLVYLLASIFILPAIFSMAELSAAIPRAGGPYLFLNRSLGPLMGIIGAFGKYVQLLLKGAFAFVGVGAYIKLVLEVDIEPVAIGLIIIFTILNLVGVKQTAKTEIILVGLLLLLLTYFVISGILQFQAESISFQEEFQPLFPFGIEGVFAGIALIFVSYGGVGQIASLAEEIKQPERSIPRGMLIALAVSTVFYVLGISLMVLLLSPDSLRNDQASVATVAEQLSELPLPVIVVVVAALAAFASTGNAAIMSAARYPLALARDHLIWKKFGKLDSKGVPKIAVITTGILLILLVIAFDVKGIAKLASAFLLFVFVGMCLAVIIFRESGSQEYQPGFKSPLYPWTQIFGIVAYIALIIESGLEAIGFMAAICVACFLWFHFGIQKKKRKQTAAIFKLFARLAPGHEREQAIGEAGIPMLGGTELSRLAERAIVIELKKEKELEKVVQQAADVLSKHLGGDRNEIAKHLQEEISHWKSPINSKIAVSPVLLQGIEQAEMVVIRGKITLNENSLRGLIVLVDDENSSGRLMMLISQLEAVIFHSDFPKQWEKAQNTEELKEALMHNVQQAQSLTIRIDGSKSMEGLIGKSLQEASLPEDCLVVLIQRAHEVIIPKGSTVIQEGDKVTIVASDKAMDSLKKEFSDQKNQQL